MSSLIRKIEALNSRPTALSVDTPLKRAFLDARGKPYFGQINVKVCGERMDGHLSIMESIREQNLFGENDTYLGAAGFLNLTYAAHLEAERIILFDINPAQAIFWNEISENLARNPTSEGFKSDVPKMIANIYRKAAFIKNHFEKQDLFRGFEQPAEEGFEKGKNPKLEKWILSNTQENTELEWLKNPELYKHLHNVAKKDNICSLTIDVMDEQAWEQLAEVLEEEDYHVGFAYLSNIIAFHGLNSGADFLGRDKDWENDPQTIRNNVKICMTEEARIVAVEDLQHTFPYMSFA